MAEYGTISQLNGNFKKIYPKGIENLVSKKSVLHDRIPFEKGEKVGEMISQPVMLTNEHGFSYGGPTAGAFALHSAVAMTMKEAQVQPYQVVLRSRVPYDAISRALSSEAAFKKTTSLVMENMTDSFTTRQENDYLYGQMSSTYGGTLGIADSSANSTSTKTVITVKTASWAPGIWAGAENAVIGIVHYDDNAAIHATAANNVFTVSAVDFDNRKITVTGTSTGIADLDTALSSEDGNMYWYSQIYSDSSTVTLALAMQPGIKKIITNTGTLFNISAADFTAWAGNQLSAASQPLSFSKIVSAVSKAVGKGGLTGRVLCLTSLDGWTNLNQDQAGARKYGAEVKNAENGAQTIKFHHMNGEIEVLGHPCVQLGDCFVLKLDDWMRVGSRDLQMGAPGEEDSPFQRIEGYAGVEARAYCDQTIFCKAPNRQTLIHTIVNA